MIAGGNLCCGNNVNNDVLASDEMIFILVVLLVVHSYKSVSYNNLPESGLARVLSTKYCESGTP